MQCEFTVIVFDGMPRIGSALKTDDDIRALGQGIRDLSFSFVAPISAHNCCHHNGILLLIAFRD